MELLASNPSKVVLQVVWNKGELMDHNPLAAIEATAINQLIYQPANPRPAQNLRLQDIKQSEAICDTLETGDPDSGGHLIPQPTNSPAGNPDTRQQDDSIDSGSILDIDG